MLLASPKELFVIVFVQRIGIEQLCGFSYLGIGNQKNALNQRYSSVFVFFPTTRALLHGSSVPVGNAVLFTDSIFVSNLIDKKPVAFSFFLPGSA